MPRAGGTVSIRGSTFVPPLVFSDHLGQAQSPIAVTKKRFYSEESDEEMARQGAIGGALGLARVPC